MSFLAADLPPDAHAWPTGESWVVARTQGVMGLGTAATGTGLLAFGGDGAGPGAGADGFLHPVAPTAAQPKLRKTSMPTKCFDACPHA